MNKTIFVVEDEDDIRQIIKDYLLRENYEVIEAYNGKEALDKIEKEHFDLAILDVMLPYVDGWTVCRRIKKKYEVPILFLTARGEEDDELMSFDVGADDYVKKPFSGPVLMARVNKLLNKQTITALAETIIKKDVLEIDKEGMKVSVEGEMIELTNKEFQILTLLAENEGKVLTREVLLRQIWGYDYFGDERVVDNHIKKIRKSLGEYAYLIRTVFGQGYIFEV
ncbi:MAG: response regulator transcription factor [Cellulosilyticaceae bacterium]